MSEIPVAIDIGTSHTKVAWRERAGEIHFRFLRKAQKIFVAKIEVIVTRCQLHHYQSWHQR